MRYRSCRVRCLSSAPTGATGIRAPKCGAPYIPNGADEGEQQCRRSEALHPFEPPWQPPLAAATPSLSKGVESMPFSSVVATAPRQKRTETPQTPRADERAINCLASGRPCGQNGGLRFKFGESCNRGLWHPQSALPASNTRSRPPRLISKCQAGRPGQGTRPTAAAGRVPTRGVVVPEALASL